MSWTLFAARTVGRSAAHLGREASAQHSGLDALLGATFGVAVVLVGIPTVLGQWLASLAGLDIGYGLGWLVGITVMAVAFGTLAVVVLRAERRGAPGPASPTTTLDQPSGEDT